jgi:hypothetical protein
MSRSLPIAALAAIAIGAAVLGSVAAPQPTHAAVSIANDTVARSSAGAYWTPQRMQQARPLPLRRVAGLGDPVRVAPGSPARSLSSEPAPGPGGMAGTVVKLHEPLELPPASVTGLEPRAASILGQTFTNARVVPMEVLRNVYPWRTVGKLFFRSGNIDFYCSGAIVQRRLIATAGHCLFDQATRQFHSDFFFVPGFDNGASPCGGYGWEWATVTGPWALGDGSLPNPADFGILMALDKDCSGQSSIGTSLGWLGWQTNVLLDNHVTILGYPCNLDRCQILQQTNAQVTRLRSPNAGEAGTQHGGGASGGPWVQDWGIPAAGQQVQSTRIVGIFSYGPANVQFAFAGSSILNGDWVEIWNAACARSGACQ